MKLIAYAAAGLLAVTPTAWADGPALPVVIASLDQLVAAPPPAGWEHTDAHAWHFTAAPNRAMEWHQIDANSWTSEPARVLESLGFDLNQQGG
jgi:hypothetical protein